MNKSTNAGSTERHSNERHSKIRDMSDQTFHAGPRFRNRDDGGPAVDL
jgi:hypothetical protein